MENEFNLNIERYIDTSEAEGIMVLLVKTEIG